MTESAQQPTAVKVGDWIAMYSPTWRYQRPTPFPASVIAVGKRIKVRTVDRYTFRTTGAIEMKSGYFLLSPPEVLHVYASFEEGQVACTNALNLWREIEDEINGLQRKRSVKVLEKLRGEP